MVGRIGATGTHPARTSSAPYRQIEQLNALPLAAGERYDELGMSAVNR
ncbi:hypothetical protein [Streptomyces inhibens]|nr:hypothetical protein [Streptomyces inhibens]